MKCQLSQNSSMSAVSKLGLLLIVVVLLGMTIVQAAVAPVSLFSAAPGFVSLDRTHFQFRATNPVGEPIPDGAQTLVFSIWDDSTGGVMLWLESQSVITQNGVGQATLGELVPIPLGVLTPDPADSESVRFLEMTINSETIVPRMRLVGTPYSNVSERLSGDILTGPGRVEVHATEELFGNYNFLLEVAGDSSAMSLTADADAGDPNSDVARTSLIILPDNASHIMSTSTGDSGIAYEVDIRKEPSGEIVATRGFYGISNDGLRARASKPKEIVVVGSKVKEVVRFYENAIEDEVATREHVSGRASGRRTYPPFRVTGAQLPDTTPAFQLSVDSGGTEMKMSKNNTDGSSCWVRVAQNSAGSDWSINSDDGVTFTKESDKSTPKLCESILTTANTNGDSGSVYDYLAIDSGFGQNIFLQSGTSDKKAVHSKALKALKDLVQGHVYTDSLFLTDGSSTTEKVDAADYALWRRRSLVTASGGESTQQKEHQTPKGFGFVTYADIGPAESGLFGLVVGDSLGENPDDYTTTNVQEVNPEKGISSLSLKSDDASGHMAELTHVIQQSGNDASAISSLRTLVSSQAMFHETKLDSGDFSWTIGKENPAVVIIGALTTLGGNLDSKLDRETSDLKSNATTTVDSTGTRWSVSAEEVLPPTRAGKRLTKAEVITELASSTSTNEFSDDDVDNFVQSQATAASSKLFVGGLAWSTSDDGVEVKSEHNGRKTVRAHDFIALSTDTGSTFELAAEEDKASMTLNSGDNGVDGKVELIADNGGCQMNLKNASTADNGASLNVDNTGMVFEMYQNIIDKSKIQKFVMQHSPTAGSKLFVGNLGFNNNDGLHVNADLVGGTKVGINTATPGVALQVVGSICYTGGITSCSDGRYKEDIETIDNALDLVEHLRGVEYKWKKDEYPDMRFSDGQQLGLVAQEVKEVLPELVTEDAGGYYSVDYVKLTPILIEAIKEQQKTIEELKKKVSDKDELTERLNKLERLVGAIVDKN